MEFLKKITVPEKYLISQIDKKEIKKIFRRTMKVILLLVGIKLLRIYLMKNNAEKNELISVFLSTGSPVELIRLIAITAMFLGIAGLVICYLIMGASVLKKPIFSYYFFPLVIEGIYMYTYPEVHLAIIRAIFTTY